MGAAVCDGSIVGACDVEVGSWEMIGRASVGVGGDTATSSSWVGVRAVTTVGGAVCPTFVGVVAVETLLVVDGGEIIGVTT